MTCTRCHGNLSSCRGDAEFSVGGTPVTLCGIETSVCPSCGEREVVVPNIDGLHRVVRDLERKAGRTLHLDLRVRRGRWETAAVERRLPARRRRQSA
ncbi:MAG: hypothetical protein HY905_15120 [Deltaproteobacteria bacterium]|nr:hypothetical protein [Deltaproteobacteria bacterium]